MFQFSAVNRLSSILNVQFPDKKEPQQLDLSMALVKCRIRDLTFVSLLG